MAHLIGIYSAEQGEGKTTVANRFRGRADDMCRVLSFTDLVDNFVDRLLGHQGLGLHYLETEFDNTPIPQLKGITPKRMKQTLMTEWGENCVHPDLWVKIAEIRINQAMYDSHFKYVIVDGITDKNQFEMIKRLGGEFWRVDKFTQRSHFSSLEPFGVGEYPTPDRVILNRGSIDELRNKVDRIIKEMEFFEKYKPGDAIPIHVCNENISLYVKKEIPIVGINIRSSEEISSFDQFSACINEGIDNATSNKCYWSGVRLDGRKQWEEISRELFDALLQREIYKEES